MRVIYIVKSELHKYPPCITQIRLLKRLGIHVEVWYGSCDGELLRVFDSENIPYKNLNEKRGKFPGRLDKANNWIQFGNAVEIEMNQLFDFENILFWFGTAESAIPLLGRLKGLNYALTSLELLDDEKAKRDLFGLLAKNAQFIVCCEMTRAYIMRYWYGLDALPYVMPNKPYGFDCQRFKVPSTQASREAVERIKSRDFIIYQGILKSRDYMVEMAKAIRDSETGYSFVLMGQDPEGIFVDIKRAYSESLFISNIPAPFHLEVTSYAGIGFVFYDDRNTLNRAFCAPNKIYEYSGFGIPSIGNDVPGLVNTIGAAQAGICCPIEKNRLIEGIKSIVNKYDFYARNARDFFDKTDNEKTMIEIVEKHLQPTEPQ